MGVRHSLPNVGEGHRYLALPLKTVGQGRPRSTRGPCNTAWPVKPPDGATAGVRTEMSTARRHVAGHFPLCDVDVQQVAERPRQITPPAMTTPRRSPPTGRGDREDTAAARMKECGFSLAVTPRTSTDSRSLVRTVPCPWSRRSSTSLLCCCVIGTGP